MERDEIRLFRNIICFILTIFLLVPISVHSTSLDEAITLYRQGDFQNSYQALLKLSRDDNSQAFFLLGKMYERGDGVYRDDSKAAYYYKKAADLGLSEAMERIDQLRDGENSVVLDWYLESAWDGDVESVFNLGYLYESGMGVRIDESLALQWYEEAASQGHADAQLRLGLMLIAGAGVDDDVSSGKQWILKAASNGNKVAQTIEILLIKKNKNIDIVKLVRGLRTLEHSNEAIMLQVLLSSVAQMTQPTSLSLLNESPPSKSDEANSLSVNNILSRNEAVSENKNKIVVPLENISKEENSVLFWVIIAIILTGIFTTLVHYLFQRRFSLSRQSKWEGDNQFVVPELKMDSNDREFLRNLWGKEKKMTLPDNFRNNVESHVTESPTFIDAEISSDIQTKNLMLEKVVMNVESRSRAQISYDDLVPKRVVDLQMPSLIDSSEYPLLEVEMKTAEIEFTDVVVNQQPIVQEKEIKNSMIVTTDNSYIKEQVREFEAAKSNDVDAVSEARLKIGLMFLHGDGVVANIPLAIKWLKRSVEHGNLEAEVELNQLYFKYPEFCVDDNEDQRFTA